MRQVEGRNTCTIQLVIALRATRSLSLAPGSSRPGPKTTSTALLDLETQISPCSENRDLSLANLHYPLTVFTQYSHVGSSVLRLVTTLGTPHAAVDEREGDVVTRRDIAE